MTSAQTNYLTQLLTILIGRYNMEGLRELAFMLMVDWDELRGDIKSTKARALIAHLGQQGKLNSLLTIAQSTRDDIDTWPLIPSAEAQIAFFGNDINEPDHLAFHQPSLKWILVAGLGKEYLLPDHQEVYFASRQFGRAIAQQGWGLLTGGWAGVDYITADAFAKALKQADKPLSDYLLQVVPEGDQPQFKGGKCIFTKSGHLEWINIVNKADAIILLGGEGGTYQTYQFGVQERVPVFPIPTTKGDALTVYQEMLSNWDAKLMDNITPMAFAQTLTRKITSDEDAFQVAQETMSLITKL